MKNIVNRVGGFLGKMLAKVAAVAAAAALTVSSFAADGDYVGVTNEMLEPVLEGAKANLGVIVPVGVGLFAIVMGIGFIPLMFRKFRKG